ncbi:MAG: F0F1 ATP synthase subunit delta [Bacilli bacterium]|nr:F0F1 ATP synthase subunit delta [Bacilli bacterium]
MEELFVRYATALLELAIEEKKVSEYKEALASIFDVFNEDESIQKYLESFFEDNDKKFQIVDTLCEPFKLKHLSSFMKLIVSKHLILHFKELYKSFNKLANEELGIEEGFVYSTYKLSKEEIKKIADSLEKRTSRKVELTNLIDESLIGGVKVIIKDRVYDGSVKYKLDTMKSKLIKKGA